MEPDGVLEDNFPLKGPEEFVQVVAHASFLAAAFNAVFDCTEAGDVHGKDVATFHWTYNCTDLRRCQPGQLV